MNSLQRRYLKAQVHHMEPVIYIGKNGLTEGTIHSINTALSARELIKIKFREYKDKKKSLSQQIKESTDSNVVGMIGHCTILFRQNADPEKQTIKLPTIK